MCDETSDVSKGLGKANSGGFIGIGHKEALEELLKAEEVKKQSGKANSGGFIGIGLKEALEELGTAEEMRK